MMRLRTLIIIPLIFLLSFGWSYAQMLPNTFTVGDFAEVLPHDSLKVWYSNYGRIVSSQCAAFYRIGRIASEKIGWTGEIRDVDLKGNVIFKAAMTSSGLNGKAFFYYPNGRVRETGTYINDERKGIWKYYYENGNAEKIMNFTDTIPEVLQRYYIDGVQKVADGNGFYSGNFHGFRISGNIKNGKMDGKWNFGGLSEEEFHEGHFVSGVSTKEYGGEPYKIQESKISLIDFYPNENVSLIKNDILCPGNHASFLLFKSETPDYIFYPQLISKIKSYPALNNQWVIVGISFTKFNRIATLHVYSSKADTGLERFIYNYIVKLNGWTVAIIKPANVPAPLLFTINIDSSLGDEKVLIPAEYETRGIRKLNKIRNRDSESN